MFPVKKKKWVKLTWSNIIINKLWKILNKNYKDFHLKIQIKFRH